MTRSAGNHQEMTRSGEDIRLVIVLRVNGYTLCSGGGLHYHFDLWVLSRDHCQNPPCGFVGVSASGRLLGGISASAHLSVTYYTSARIDSLPEHLELQLANEFSQESSTEYILAYLPSLVIGDFSMILNRSGNICMDRIFGCRGLSLAIDALLQTATIPIPVRSQRRDKASSQNCR